MQARSIKLPAGTCNFANRRRATSTGGSPLGESRPVTMPKVGLEPTRPEGHWILSPARLPVPPLRRSTRIVCRDARVRLPIDGRASPPRARAPPACRSGGALWREYGWRAEPDAARLVREHEALCELLAATVPRSSSPNRSTTILTPSTRSTRDRHRARRVLLRPGRTAGAARWRRPRRLCGLAGVPSRDARGTGDGGGRRLHPPRRRRTLLAGRSYRTNAMRASSRPRLSRGRDGRLRPPSLAR